MRINTYKIYNCYVTEEQANLFNDMILEGVDDVGTKRSNARRYGHHQKSVDLAVAYELYKIYLKEKD